MYAHIFGTKAKGFTLYVTSGPEIVGVNPHSTHATKRLAAEHAKSLGLTPWNY